MDALRRSFPFVLLTVANLTGCSLFQPKPASQNPKPEEPNPRPASEVVEKPATKTKLANDAEPEESQPQMSAIEQWAEQMAKRNGAKEPGGRKPTNRAALDARRPPNTNALFAGDEAAEEDGGGVRIPVEPTTGASTQPPVQENPKKKVTTGAAPRSVLPPTDPPEESVEPPAPKPPVLQGVNANAAIELRDPGNRQARGATTNAPENASETSATLKELLDRWLTQSGDNSFRQQLDRRVLCVLSGDYDKARQPLEMATKDQQAMASRFVEAMIAIHEGHGGEPGSEAGRVLANVEQLREALLPTTELSLPAFAICRAVKGFGQYEPFDPPQFTAGRESEFVAYCEIRDFLSDKRSDGTFQSTFSLKVAVLNRVGDKVYEMAADEIIDRCRTRRRDCFLSPLVRLPATISAGDYVVKVTIADKIGKKVAEKTATLRIVAKS